MSKNSDLASNSANTLSLLGVAFIVLKLCHVINWSWWWVLLPFWGGLVLFLILVIIILIMKLF